MMGRAMEGSFVAVLFCGLAGSASRFGREGDEQADAERVDQPPSYRRPLRAMRTRTKGQG
jgi:hypothetical protein